MQCAKRGPGCCIKLMPSIWNIWFPPTINKTTSKIITHRVTISCAFQVTQGTGVLTNPYFICVWYRIMECEITNLTEVWNTKSNSKWKLELLEFKQEIYLKEELLGCPKMFLQSYRLWWLIILVWWWLQSWLERRDSRTFPNIYTQEA